MVFASGHTSLVDTRTSPSLDTKAKLVSISSIYLPHTRQKWALDPTTFWTRLVWLCLNHVVFLLFLTFPVSAKLWEEALASLCMEKFDLLPHISPFSLLVLFFFSCSPYKVFFLFLHSTILPPPTALRLLLLVFSLSPLPFPFLQSHQIVFLKDYTGSCSHPPWNRLCNSSIVNKNYMETYSAEIWAFFTWMNLHGQTLLTETATKVADYGHH